MWGQKWLPQPAPARAMAAMPSSQTASSTPELRPDDHLAVRSELDPSGRRLHGRGHRLDQAVHTEGQPRFRRDRLETPYDLGLSGAGATVQDDYLSAHSRVPAYASIEDLQSLYAGW